MACILLIHMNIFKESAIRSVMQQKNIRCITVAEKQENTMLGELAGMKGIRRARKGGMLKPAEEMMVFCGLEDTQLDEVLADLRKHEISVSLKAVLTSVNAGWDAGFLYEELVRERNAFRKG